MEYNKVKVLIAVVGAMLLASACNVGGSKKDVGFYDYSKINYIYRLPLIEPYEVTSPDNGANWTLSFKNVSPPSHGVQFLTKVGIKDGFFVAYSPRDLSFSSDHPKVWAVVDVMKKEEKVFTDEAAYKAYLKSKGLEEINLYELNTVFQKFDSSKTLPDEWPTK